MKRRKRNKNNFQTFLVTILFVALVSGCAYVSIGREKDKENSSQSSDKQQSSEESREEISSDTSEENPEEDSSSTGEENDSSSREESAPDLPSSSEVSSREDREPEESSSQSEDEKPDKKNLPMLINADNPLPDGFNPDLVALNEYHKLERETAKHYYEMVEAARQDGISIWCASGYRSYETQKRLWDKRYANNLAIYKDEEKAFLNTRYYTAYPGTSEHQTGMAIDFNGTDDNFGDTKEGQWLLKYAHKFGFILRYPDSKTEYTNTLYEPWHYRYVGVEFAEDIKNSGLCLEEYIEANK